jgi:biopolymer transport protein ExbD
MIKSRRAKRMERNHQKAKTPGLNLVALLDIFCVIVFFLLVNSSTSQYIPSSKKLKLPESSSQKSVEETIIIEITRTDILVQGAQVIAVDKLSAIKEEIIPALKDELNFLSQKNTANANAEAKKEFQVTIMGDENVSYDLLKKILTTCQQANYTKIAFATLQTAKVKTQ